MSVSTQGNVINLEAEVDIRQGDLRVQAERARIYFDAAPRRVGRDALTRAELRGNVRFSFGKGTAQIRGSCDRAEFLPHESVVLSGNVQATRGGNIIRGRQIIYYLHTGWIKVSEAEGVMQAE